MELRRELFLAIGVLVVLNVLLAFVSIGLFARMGPAIEQILHGKVYAIAATEGLLASFAEASVQPLSTNRQKQVRRTFEQAKKESSDPEIRALLSHMAVDLDAALLGDSKAIATEVDSIRTIIRLNRRAMQRVDRTAQQLSLAGAWAAVFVGFTSFVLSLLALRRLKSRILSPLIELHDVLTAAKNGEHHRRCQLREAPVEIHRVLVSVNRLLDDRQQLPNPRENKVSSIEHMALIELLDRQRASLLVIDPEGNIVAANASGLRVLAGPRGLAIQQALRALGQGVDAPSELAQSVPLRDNSGWLVAIKDLP
ncbi:MAG: hypothetical protein H6714_03435 [Myxococcales bacterium]|nr:hypothetical protein [Myxococcales bacterium]